MRSSARSPTSPATSWPARRISRTTREDRRTIAPGRFSKEAQEDSMTREQRLAEVFVELADNLVEEFDVVDFLQTLTERAVELSGADSAGLMLDNQRGGLQVVAYTDKPTRLLELLELQNDEGPCLDCFSSGKPVYNVDLSRAESRWPRF